MLAMLMQLQKSLIGRLLQTLALILLTVTASHAGSQGLLTTVKYKNVTLELSNQQGKCAVLMNKTTTSQLDIPWPCGFVRTDKKQVAQSHHYSDVGQVFIIAGPPVATSAYSKDASVTPEHLCSNHGQAIIHQTGTLILRKAQNIPLGFCHQLGFDEKDYYGYAYPVE